MNPTDREDALDRVLDEVLGYADPRDDVAVRANSTTLPDEYEIDFVRESFGPPSVEGGEPTRVDRHTLLVQLGPEFPGTAPDVFWTTPFFHPNVFPNYDCDQYRRDPAMAGWVCLGMLAESWYPERDFGDLCRMLVEMAGFRNYDLFEPSGEHDDRGPLLRGNFVDQTAARWAATHQDEIVAIGGRPIAPRAVEEPRRARNVIRRMATG